MATEQTGWWREIASAIIGGAGFDALKGLLAAFTKSTGEQVGKEAADWISFKMWGLKTEDERLFNQALNLVPPNEWTRHSKRLVMPHMTPEANDYYRITLMHKDAKVIAETIVRHAQMSDPEWKRHAEIMNLNLGNANATWAALKRWGTACGTQTMRAITGLGDAVNSGVYGATGTCAEPDEGSVLAIVRQAKDGLAGLADRLKEKVQNRS